MTFLCIVIALYVKPFADPVLGSLYVYALGVQMVTLLYGLLLITNRFDDLTGEPNGWLGPMHVPSLIVGINASIFAIPILKLMITSIDLSDMWVHVLTALRSCIPCCFPKSGKSGANRRQQIREHVRDLRIDLETVEEPEDDNPAFDFDVQERKVAEDLMDAVADVEEEDVFKKGPVPAEFAGVNRMAQHAYHIEQRARVLMDQATTPEKLKEVIPEFKILLHNMRSDAAVLQEEMPSIDAQERLRDIAFNSIHQLEVRQRTSQSILLETL